MTQHQVDAWFGSPYAGARSRGGLWSVQRREPGLVVASYRQRGYQLALGIHYMPERVTFEVLSSLNLQETPRTIHRTALRWIHELQDDIVRSLKLTAR
jgi:hypothetical protein